MEVWNNITLPDVPMLTAAPAATRPTPIPISGLVNSSNPTEFDYIVDAAGMCAGSFTQDATSERGPAGICGNADMVGVMMRHDLADYPTADVFEVVGC